MVNYQKSKIYKLYSPSKNLTYIGSTTQLLCKRLVFHLGHYKAYNNDNSRKYYTSFLVLDCEDYKIELLEDYTCNNKQQLEKKEGEYIRNNECVNKIITGRTRQEYCIDNADKIKQYKITNADKIKEQRKQYKIDNAEKIKEQNKQYNINNADKIKEQKKQYRIDNADKISERNKQYRIDNADKISERKRQYYLKKKAENQL